MPSAYSDQFKQQCVDAVLVLGKSRAEVLATMPYPFRQEPLSDGAQDSMADAIGDVSYDIPTTRLGIGLLPSQRGRGIL